MISLSEELLILKSLVKMYEVAMAKNDAVLMMEIAVDIAESAEKLEQASVDNANQAWERTFQANRWTGMLIM